MSVRCPNDGTLLGTPYSTCPICKQAPMKHPLLRRNPKPFPAKRQYAKYCAMCDHTVVRPYNFNKCPNCGSHIY